MFQPEVGLEAQVLAVIDGQIQDSFDRRTWSDIMSSETQTASRGWSLVDAEEQIREGY